MKTIDKFLVASNLSSYSGAVVIKGANLARPHNATLSIVNIIENSSDLSVVVEENKSIQSSDALTHLSQRLEVLI